MTPIQVKISVWLIAIGFVMTFFTAAGLFIYVYGPCIEPYVLGYVVDIPRASEVWRGYIRKRETGREVEVGCFSFDGLHKLAAAIPYKYAFQIEARLSDRINVSAYLSDPDHQRSAEDLQTHPAGAVWKRSYCFEMPGTIGNDQAIRVSGHAEHTRIIFGKRAFWYSITPVPEFDVEPTACYGADGLVSRAPECRG